MSKQNLVNTNRKLHRSKIRPVCILLCKNQLPITNSISALLLVLAKRDVFDNLLVKDRNCIGAREEHNCMDTTNETVTCSPLVSLFADAVKGSLLSSNTEVQAGALDLISHFLSWRPGCVDQIQAFIEENITDYIFEVLRLSGNT